MRITSSTRFWRTKALPYKGFGFTRYYRRIPGRRPRTLIGQASKAFLLAMLCALSQVTSSNLGAEVTNRIVATVNSDIITLFELNNSIKQMTGMSAASLRLLDDDRFYQVRRAVLNTLINQKITEQQIRRSGIRVTDRDIEKAVEKVKRENNLTQEELLYTLKLEGITFKEYTSRVKREIERARLVNYEVKSKIVITEQDLRDYYLNHSEQFSEVHKVKLARILLKIGNPTDREGIARVRDVGEEIMGNLKAGCAFSDMAKAYSQGPAAPEGGCLGWISFDQLDASLKKRVMKLSPGEYTEFHPCPYGVQTVQLIDERKAGMKPFEKVRDAIYSKLFQGKVEERYATWLSKLREESFIKVVF
jgi:peptidyl-prolyl cis-trans isomerase SurA